MHVKFTGAETGHNPPPMQINCPFCGGFGTFQVLNNLKTDTNTNISVQSCPSLNCKALVLGIFKGIHLQKTYPGLGRPVNTDNVPNRIKSAFKEGVECFANNCHVAAAIMIRKTLEEICIDKGATGNNLYKKIEDLSTKILIPKELVEAMHELRLLGNDAAHIEAETYNEIGVNELTISIDFTQEIIKAIYQYENLLTKLRSLKKPNDAEITSPE
ncbi:MAG TPA: DUF4145 domain-containing protein [Saprospiraceae bacterium]|nr:DUF4145 domain-containing protein [Saprospiraceae bacterium]